VTGAHADHPLERLPEAPPLQAQGLPLFHASSICFALTTIALFALRSPSLDEWDSVQFAQGVLHFDLNMHRPHPPGYPLYIFSGWLLHTVLGMAAPLALSTVSALCGGLFVTAWFAHATQRFGRPIALLLATSLLLTPAVWMTATKVLTDIPSSAFFALQLLASHLYTKHKTLRWLVLVALCGALCSGMRPQNTGIVLLLTLQAVGFAQPRSARHWLAALALFILLHLAWLLPTMWTQSRTEGSPGMGAYAAQLLHQWRWRLDKPEVFLGAGEVGTSRVVERVAAHWGGWFYYGFGFRDTFQGIAAALFFLMGWIIYLWHRTFWRDPAHRTFWYQMLPWALLYSLTILICLPHDQRYYVPIYPLLILGAVVGWWSLVTWARWLAVGFPLMLFFILFPLARDNAFEDVPPLRLIHHVEELHPPEERPRVVLILKDSYRHGQWYAEGFQVLRQSEAAAQPQALHDALAVYTDSDDTTTKLGWPDDAADKLKGFRRNKLIYRKHSNVTLYRLTVPSS